MTTASSHQERDDVLDAFSVEPRHDRETLERYLTLHPDLAGHLVDLSRELSRTVVEDDGPASAEDAAAVEAALLWHRRTTLGGTANPFAGVETPRLREIARELKVPSQVIAAFREGKVLLSSVPRRFLGRLASALDVTMEALVGGLLGNAAPMGARSYKSDGRPGGDGAVSFERILFDAGIEGDELDALLAEAN